MAEQNNLFSQGFGGWSRVGFHSFLDLPFCLVDSCKSQLCHTTIETRGGGVLMKEESYFSCGGGMSGWLLLCLVPNWVFWDMSGIGTAHGESLHK